MWELLIGPKMWTWHKNAGWGPVGALVNTVMKLRVPWKSGNFSTVSFSTRTLLCFLTGSMDKCSDKPIAPQLVNGYPLFEPHESTPHTHTSFPWDIRKLAFHLRLGLPRFFFPSRFPSDVLSMHLSCLTHVSSTNVEVSHQAVFYFPQRIVPQSPSTHLSSSL